jgi:hypothetical protein
MSAKLASAEKKQARIEPAITPSERVLAQLIGQAYSGLLAHRNPYDENPSQEDYLDHSAYVGQELWERWKRIVKEQRTIDNFEEHTK